jgi:hypothetical protein
MLLSPRKHGISRIIVRNSETIIEKYPCLFRLIYNSVIFGRTRQINPVLRNGSQREPLRHHRCAVVRTILQPLDNEVIAVKIQCVPVLNISIARGIGGVTGGVDIHQTVGLGIAKSLHKTLKGIGTFVLRVRCWKVVQIRPGIFKIRSRPGPKFLDNVCTQTRHIRVKVIVEDVVLALVAKDVAAAGAHRKKEGKKVRR